MSQQNAINNILGISQHAPDPTIVQRNVATLHEILKGHTGDVIAVFTQESAMHDRSEPGVKHMVPRIDWYYRTVAEIGILTGDSPIEQNGAIEFPIAQYIVRGEGIKTFFGISDQHNHLNVQDQWTRREGNIVIPYEHLERLNEKFEIDQDPMDHHLALTYEPSALKVIVGRENIDADRLAREHQMYTARNFSLEEALQMLK